MRINPEKKEDRERVAHELLRVTLRLANAHGFVSLGLREVSRAADIAPTSFYRHFADMEELGRALIENVAGPFIAGWTLPVKTPPLPGSVALTIAGQALACVSEDPELMRFILAERVGAIPSFRSALAVQLAAVSSAVRIGIAEELAEPSGSVELVADAIVVLILAACGDALDQGPDSVGKLSERLSSQIHLVLAGATPKKRS